MLPLIIIMLLLVFSVLIFWNGNIPFAKVCALGALGISFAASLVLVFITARGGQAGMTVGYNDPWNISFSVDILESFMACLITGIGFFVMWASVTMIEHEVEKKHIPLYFALVCSLVSMLCGVVFFDNLFNIFIFIELSSFAAAGIVMIKKNPKSIRAGIKYLAFSIFGSAFVFMGIVVLYSLTGSMTMPVIHSSLLHNFEGNSGSVFFALAFIAAGVGFKSALFPMHIWLPDAYGNAPSPSSAILSSIVNKAFVVFYIKVLYIAVGRELIGSSETLLMLLDIFLVMGTIAMLAGSIFAAMQTDIKRMIAYSSVAQIGYIFMGIGLGSELGLFAAIYNVLSHSITKAGLFLVAGTIIIQTRSRRLDKMDGLGYEMPVTMALFAVGAFSMIGLPLFIGFNSKWFFAVSIMDSGRLWVIAPLIISSLLNIAYYLPPITRSFFGDKAREKSENRVSLERPLGALMPIIALSFLVVFFALYSEPVADLLKAGIAKIW